MASALDDLPVQVPVDPDAQATVTDFLDYTEYLPADLVRSLTLIRKLDESYLVSSAQVHELAKLYGALPSMPVTARPDPQELRSNLSVCLSRALSTRGSAYAEATRLYEVVDHHYSRLASIISKLQALPKPPSRDPTPAAPASASPQTLRSTRGRHAVDGDVPAPRITLRLDGARSAAAGRSTSQNNRRKNRSRRVTVPGEVLPPPDPDSSPLSSGSDWDSPLPSPVPVPTTRVGGPARESSTAANNKPLKPPRPPKSSKQSKSSSKKAAAAAAQAQTSDDPSKPATKPSGNGQVYPQPWPVLDPPPENAALGGEHRPWLRLTEWELSRLRKRMKKNAIWTPSETMLRRELADLCRGPEAYQEARARAIQAGEEFLDWNNIEGRLAQGKMVLALGEIGIESLGPDELQLSNRGMKLNEAKKLKKELMQREMEAQAVADADGVTKQPVEPGSGSKPEAAAVGESSSGAAATSKDVNVKRSHKKRKRETSPEDEGDDKGDTTTSRPTETTQKKRKKDNSAAAGNSTIATTGAAAATTTTTTTVPLAAPGPSSDRPSSKATTDEAPAPLAAPPRRQASTAPKSSTPDRPSTARPRSSRGTTAAATDIETTAGKDRPRRASTISTAAAAAAAAAADSGRLPPRRSKRPVPGRLTGNVGEGGPAVTVGKRSAAPRKKTGSKKPKGSSDGVAGGVVDENDEENLPVDPDEPRYCVCGDVSFGQMIQCENNDVSLSSLYSNYPCSPSLKSSPCATLTFLFFHATNSISRDWSINE